MPKSSKSSSKSSNPKGILKTQNEVNVEKRKIGFKKINIEHVFDKNLSIVPDVEQLTDIFNQVTIWDEKENEKPGKPIPSSSTKPVL